MVGEHFDLLTRGLGHVLSRRLLAGGLSLAAIGHPGLAEAKKKKRKKRRKKKKVKRNDFGCVNVGSFCKNDEQCCSGICEGKKQKRKCVAHDQSTCQAGQTPASCGGADVPCVTTAGVNGACVKTTGNGPYCAIVAECFPCDTDADCQLFCGPEAACMVCEGESCAETGGTQCARPATGDCKFP